MASTNEPITSFMVQGMSLFIGMHNGYVIQWKSPGVTERIFISSFYSDVISLFQHDGILWSAFGNNFVTMWEVDTGNVVKTIVAQSPLSHIVFWKENIFGQSVSHGIHVWNPETLEIETNPLPSKL